MNDRGPADLVLALALIHHLVLSAYVPIPLIAQWFSSLSKRLLVEFVPPEDPMVQKLLSNREGEHLPYSEEVFFNSFEKLFTFEDQIALENGRKLFLCEAKSEK